MEEIKVKTGYLWIALGMWLIAAALTFQSSSMAMLLSDGITGLFLIGLGFSAIKSKCQRPLWEGVFLGFWLQLAPLVFWCPEALFYLNDTLVGALLIVLGFTANRVESKAKAASIPAGWSYNPSAWNHRIPTVALAFLCWFFARYMAAFQLGYIQHIWDPFFGDGTLHVITSKISKDFPLSDAGMGALCYTLEALLGWQGDEERWHKMPWLVLIFGILVVPVGIASITLIILQPVAVGAWCGWCLMTAACMLLMVVFTGGELVAVIQYLHRSYLSKKNIWRLFWKGSGSDREHITAVSASKQGKWGITIPWNLAVLALLGAWLMMSPQYFQYQKGILAIGNYIEGPLMIAVSVIACAEVFRSLRYLHLVLGLGLLVTVWFYPEPYSSPNWNNYAMGVLAILLCVPRGHVKEAYGSFTRCIF